MEDGLAVSLHDVEALQEMSRGILHMLRQRERILEDARGGESMATSQRWLAECGLFATSSLAHGRR